MRLLRKAEQLGLIFATPKKKPEKKKATEPATEDRDEYAHAIDVQQRTRGKIAMDFLVEHPTDNPNVKLYDVLSPRTGKVIRKHIPRARAMEVAATQLDLARQEADETIKRHSHKQWLEANRQGKLVKHPGIRGGHGYYDAHGIWHYGTPAAGVEVATTPPAWSKPEAPATVAAVEPPPVSPPTKTEPAVDIPAAAGTIEPPPAEPSPPPPASSEELTEHERREIEAWRARQHPADVAEPPAPAEPLPPPATMVPPPAEPEPPVEPEPPQPEKPTYDPLGKTVPEGLYAVPSRTGTNDLDFYKIDVGREGGKWAGMRFVERITGAGVFKVRGREGADALVRIQHYGVDWSRARYGQAMRQCGKCGRALTDAVSRALGIGPVCRAGMGEEIRKLVVPPVDPDMPDPPKVALPMPEGPAPTLEQVTGEPEPTPEPEPAPPSATETAIDALRDELKIRSIQLRDETTNSGRPCLAMTGNTYAHNDTFQKLKKVQPRGLVWGTKLPGGVFAWCTFEDRALDILGYFNAERAQRIRERDTGQGSGDSGAGGLRPDVRESEGAAGGAAGLGAGGVQGGPASPDGGMVHGAYTQEGLKRLTNEQLAVIGPPAPQTPLDPSLAPILDPIQQDDVRLIADAWKRGDSGFLLGNFTGTGKTVVSLAAIKQLGMPRTLVVVPNQTLVDQWAADAKRLFGMEIHGRLPENAAEPGVFVTTYAMLRQKDHPLHGQFGLMVPDEIHMQGMKLTQGKKTAQMMADISGRSRMTIYSTASPYEAPHQLYYLRELKLWPPRKGAWRTWATDHGVRFVEKKVARDKWVTVAQWHGSRDSKLHDMLRIRASIVGNGKGVFRELKVDQPLTSDFRAVESHHGEYGSTVQRAMRAMEDLSSAAIKVNIQKRLLDYVKLDAASDAAAEAVGHGQHVVMMVSNKSPFRFSDPAGEDDDDEIPSRIRQEVIERFSRAGLTGELPSPTELLRQKIAAKLGEKNVAVFTGDVAQGKRAKLKAAFNEGKLPVLISTIAAGGTGLSLHDTKGDAPRTQINVGLPWTGRDFMQMLGRTYRRGTASPVHQVFFWTSHPREQRIAETVAGRLDALTAGVRGITAEKNAAKLAEFAVRGSDIEDDIRDEDRDLATKSRAWLDRFFD